MYVCMYVCMYLKQTTEQLTDWNFVFTSMQLVMSPHNHIRGLRNFAVVQVESYILHDIILRFDGPGSSPDAY